MKTRLIYTLFFLISLTELYCQANNIDEAHKILLGGWELQPPKTSVGFRDQLYFFNGDSMYRRFARKYPPRNWRKCTPDDTVTIDQMTWKIIEFDKKRQIVKIAFVGVKRVKKFSCSTEPLTPSGSGVFLYKLVSNDEIVGRNDHRKYKMIYTRKQNQIQFEAR